MKINMLNDILNKDIEKYTSVSKKEFYEYFFKLLNLRISEELTNNEIKLLSTLCIGNTVKDSGISKNNVGILIKSLNRKGFMNGNELAEHVKSYVRFEDTAEIIFKFKKDDTR